MLSINARLIIAMIMVTIAFLAILWVYMVVVGLSAAFGDEEQATDIVWQAIPTILGFLFVIHTMWSARSHINEKTNIR